MNFQLAVSVRFLLSVMLTGSWFIAAAQNRKSADAFYSFDANWNPSSPDSAIYFIVVTPVDSSFEWDYYWDHGPLVRMETHTTHDGSELNGPVYFYTRFGNIDSVAHFDHGKKEGAFYKSSVSARRRNHNRTVYTYHQDSLISATVDGQDTIHANSRLKDIYVPPDSPSRQSESWIRKQIEAHPTDTALEIESSYPGGLTAWADYLKRNLHYPEEAVRRNLSGIITIVFMVDEKGGTSDFVIQHSANFWLDREALRVLKKSGKWRPAYQHGRYVKSYKLQPVTMRLE